MKNDFLLKTDGARRLYEAARDLPIIDFHNHLSVADMAADRCFDDLTALWLTADPYKHRLMRICGVEERFITGDADPYEKFEKYCEIFPLLAGNPVYDWSRMELSRIFGIDTLPTRETARYIYDRAGEMLRSPEFSNNGILSKFNIAYQSPVAMLTDDLSGFNGKTVAPSLRGDNLLAPDGALKKALTERTGIAVTDTETYIRAVCVLLDAFHAAGCRFADHALDAGFFENTPEKADMLCRLGAEYAKRGWTLLLHMDAKRKTSSRLASIAGPAGGYAAVGGSFDIAALCDLLNAMEELEALPDTVIFPLNMSDQAPLAVLQGSFSQDGTPSKVQLGPAWWWCDHALGIRNTLECIASFGAVSQFIGMTTDSRSVLSFGRHDYFRRILCSWLDEHNQTWELPEKALGEILTKICYKNAFQKIKGERCYGTEI
ncbi:MAG: glucuronate isomerase [Oscillospiraceae bacterium]|nr:glucuronate isomerase [Oscillospiraceae bacterium]